MSLSSSALAAGIFFDVVSRAAITPTATQPASCPAPCFEVRVFLDDPSGTLEVEAIQLDIGVTGATLVNLPQVGGSGAQPALNVGSPNGSISAQDGSIDPPLSYPWNLNAAIATSPTPGSYVLFALAIDRLDPTKNLLTMDPLTVQRMLAVRNDANLQCVGAACGIMLNGLLNSRIYAGRFNISGASAATTFTLLAQPAGDGSLVNGTGVGPLNPDGTITHLAELNAGSSCSLANFTTGGSCLINRPFVEPPPVPEPGAALLLGLSLAGFSLARRRS
jgi:hypothetical protein